MDPSTGSLTFDSFDIARLRVRYLAAFDRYRACAADLAEQSVDGQPPSIQELDAEQEALQELAAVRGALLDALAANSLLAETRDEMIRRSIAKRSDGNLGTTARNLRLNRRRRIA